MRKVIVLGSLLGIALSLIASEASEAFAQPPPPPPMGGPATGGGMEVAAEPKMRFEGGIIIGLPQGDLSEADTSIGIGLVFGATVAPNISVFGGLRYIKISVADAPSGVDLAYYDLLAGARYTSPVSPTMKVFGEAHLSYATVSVSADGQSASESGIGFGARGGAIFMMGPSFGIGGGVGYSTASINEGTAAWLSVEGFAHVGF